MMVWDEFDTKVRLYSYALRRKHKGMDEKKLNELVRKSINRKFKKENKNLLATTLLTNMHFLYHIIDWDVFLEDWFDNKLNEGD